MDPISTASALITGGRPTSIAARAAGLRVAEPRRIRISDAGVDLTLLISALFLQRFTLTFGNSLMELVIVPAVLILAYQFIFGRLLILYDRLLWFLAVSFVVTCSLLLNFNSTMLPSYFLFITIYSLFTLARPCSADRYRSTLRAFQHLAAILSCLAILQFIAQFFTDGRSLIHFYGVLPDFLFTERFNTVIPITEGSSFIKSNGIFLTEPSTLSQIMALAILIEVLEFRRPRRLLLFVVGLLLAYSGTGLLLLFVCMPVAAIRQRKAQLPVLLVITGAAGLVASGIIDLSAFSSRAGEFETTNSSGFERFVSPFWLASDHLNTASLRTLLVGSGPGTTDAFVTGKWYAAASGTWIKLLYEYGLLGSFVFICFLASCFRASRCPGVLRVAFVFYFVLLGGLLLDVSFLTLMMVLCTLSVPQSPYQGVHAANRSPLRFGVRSGAG
jgi:hypothetical protein